MLLKKEITLELKEFRVDENPPGYKGKWGAYKFSMVYPSTHYFFKRPKKVGDEDHAIVWGMSPDIIFYTKDWRSIAKEIEAKIRADLPDGYAWNLSGWSVQMNGCGEWAIYYSAETWTNKDLVRSTCQRVVPIGTKELFQITAWLPEEMQKLIQEDPAHD